MEFLYKFTVHWHYKFPYNLVVYPPRQQQISSIVPHLWSVEQASHFIRITMSHKKMPEMSIFPGVPRWQFVVHLSTKLAAIRINALSPLSTFARDNCVLYLIMHSMHTSSILPFTNQGCLEYVL